MSRRESTLRARVSWLAVLLLLLPLAAACGGADPGDGAGRDAGAGGAARGGGPRIVATFSILGDLVREVAGDRAQLTTLVGPGGDAHTFEPSPADNRTLADADVIFENGLGFETWLDGLYESSGSRARRVAVTEGMKSLIPAGEHEEEHAGEEGEGHGHGEYDPHVWHDVENAIYIVGRIRDALVEVDPKNAAAYRSNAERYIAELRDLDSYVVRQVATLPAERRKLVTTHDTFGYFARRYGFEVVDTALGTTTEESEPSAAGVARLIRDIKAAGVPAVFTENVSNPGVMERVARETGAEVAPPLYTDALGEPGSEGGTYVGMEKYNATTIVAALKR
jgi:ABC-type Zn uptake system ZnuABC Zn-binding protein ZnuA